MILSIENVLNLLELKLLITPLCRIVTCVSFAIRFLPWGGKWNAEKVRKFMYSKDFLLNSEFYDKDKKYHSHPCFFGTASEILNDCCGNCPALVRNFRK